MMNKPRLDQGPDYERGFVDGMQHQMQSSVDKAVNRMAQQEPVTPKCGAIIEVFGHDWRLEYLSLPVGKHKLYTQQYTYIAPPAQRTWVGLTAKDWNVIGFTAEFRAGAEWANDKLKEKNNG